MVSLRSMAALAPFKPFLIVSKANFAPLLISGVLHYVSFDEAFCVRTRRPVSKPFMKSEPLSKILYSVLTFIVGTSALTVLKMKAVLRAKILPIIF